MPAPHVIAVANRKGGVGKTTTAVHLAAALGARERQTLVVDLDAQANATLVLSDQGDLEMGGPNVASLLSGGLKLEEVIRPSTAPGVWLAPSGPELTSMVMSLSSRPGRGTLLRRALRGLTDSDFEFVVIDTPPESHLGTENALVAARWVLVPFTPDPTALHGLVAVQEMVADVVASELNRDAQLLGVLQVGYDKRMAVTEQARRQVRKAVGPLLLETTVRTNAIFYSCAGFHRSAFALEQEQGGGERRGTADYTAVADELLLRLVAHVRPSRLSKDEL
jgi:chromosome partitioning protein